MSAVGPGKASASADSSTAAFSTVTVILPLQQRDGPWPSLASTVSAASKPEQRHWCMHSSKFDGSTLAQHGKGLSLACDAGAAARPQCTELV
jgi:hypothetical protein